MAGLISTGIWGFICSATMKAGEIVSTFVSGVSGWMIKNNGDAEFKSIYARDKIVTNEYVYNRIRVTEDEEVVTGNGKILASYPNDDGTHNVQLDLREGDLNPFSVHDLLQGYYHSPGNTGVVYAVQRMTVTEVLDDQTMNVTCSGESSPYEYMVIVRVGNTEDVDRQAFIRISSRTNCQYFYDGIASFSDLDNPNKVRCVLGKADIGLIPSWAADAVGSIKRWFGLIADGVILRGTFILKNGKSVENELSGVGETITELETRFEIKEGEISSSVREVQTYTAAASEFAQSASDAAGSADNTLSRITEKESSINQTAEGFESTVTQTTAKAVTDAVTGATEMIEEKVGTAVTQSAKGWKVEVMGSDAEGNPNTILAAINADESGVLIEGRKVRITGELLAELIEATNITTGRLTVTDGANIAGFEVKNNRLESEAKLPNGDPVLALDGATGIFYGNKGVFRGAIWYNYAGVNNGGTLDPLHPNVTLINSIFDDDTVYLPDITEDIIGCCFNIYWNGVGTYTYSHPQELRSRSRNIVDFDDIGDYGMANFKEAVTCAPFKYGFIQLICADMYHWVIINKNGKDIQLS